MFEVSTEILLLLVLTGFVAGFVDAIAGGGGLITLPVIFMAGLDPITALATNKVQSVFGTASSALSYARGGHVDLREQAIPALVSLIAAFAGSLLITVLPTDFIRLLLPFLLISIALFFAFKKGLDDTSRQRRMSQGLLLVTLIPVVAGYDGLIGPGTGSFFMLGFVTLAGYGILKATAHTKFLNLASNFGSLLAFSLVATPLWATGLAMGVAQFIGAQFGAAVAQRIGAPVIKPLLVISSLSLAGKLIWDLF